MGVLSNYQESVTLVNRTIGAGKHERILTVRYDGEEVYLKPGENTGFPKIAAPYAIKQNILMGSRNPRDPRQFISLIGIVGSLLYPCTPIPEDVLAEADTKLEVIDRDGSHWGERMPGNAKLQKRSGFSAWDAQVEGGTSVDINSAIS